MIEIGRHLNILFLAQRTCSFCPEETENEFHFLLDCKTYSQMRQKRFNQIQHSCKDCECRGTNIVLTKRVMMSENISFHLIHYYSFKGV